MLHGIQKNKKIKQTTKQREKNMAMTKVDMSHDDLFSLKVNRQRQKKKKGSVNQMTASQSEACTS